MNRHLVHHRATLTLVAAVLGVLLLASVVGAAFPKPTLKRGAPAVSMPVPPPPQHPSGPPQPAELRALAHAALGDDAGVAIARLRDAGPGGLDAVFDVHAAILVAGPSHPAWERLCSTIDAVAQQRDARASRLYWYTDLERAQAAARASGKPILSLRLLGRLDEELSCANSRLFRSVLYANRDVSAVLRERFILHWRSVRPVPRVRVDFGDGRVLERTVTGNSIHYVLDTDGRLLETIPGLWGPQAFLEELARAEQIGRTLAAAEPAERAEMLRAYHGRRAVDSETMRMASADNLEGLDRASGSPAVDPSAIDAGRLTMSKMAMERPLLRTLSRPSALPDGGEVPVDPAGGPERAAIVFDSGTAALIDSKLEGRPSAGPAKRRQRDIRLAQVLERLGRDVAGDEAINRRTQSVIHQWLADGFASQDLELLNERIYAKLFLTPSSDPWLGLAPADVYTGIDAGGAHEAHGVGSTSESF